jgi:hypothetical protein
MTHKKQGDAPMSCGRDSRQAAREAPPQSIGAWLHGEPLESVAELNDQCLELLVEQASDGGASRHPLLHELADLWKSLDLRARQRAVGCPYLIVDAGFADPRNWAPGNAIHETRGSQPPFFMGVRSAAVLRLALTYGWHLARSRPAAARVLLGMSPVCAERIAACTLRQVVLLADQRPEWLQPRWSQRLPVWRALLAAAICGDDAALERARMRGLQLLAAESRTAAP